MKAIEGEGSVSLKPYVLSLLKCLDFSKLTMEDVMKYIEAHDILDGDEYYNLINAEQGGDLEKLIAQRTFVNKFALCNYPNEIKLTKDGICVTKEGIRDGVVVLCDKPITENMDAKIKILNIGEENICGIGFGITDIEGINYCPFPCSRNYGSFVIYYTFRGIGYLNCGDCSDHFIPEEYSTPFKSGDLINITVDVTTGMISFGKNEIMFEPKRIYLKKFNKMFLAVWLHERDDQILLFPD